MEIPFESSDSIKLRKASQDDKEFAYQVKKAAFREYVERAWGWRKMGKGSYTTGDTGRRTSVSSIWTARTSE